MRPDGWPEPVVRHLHRPLLTLAALAFVAGWFFLGDVASARFSGDRSDYLAVDGIVGEDWNGRGDLPVTYRNTLTDQEVETTVVVFDPGLLPAGPGASVALEVAPENPDLVFLAGDYQPATRDAAFYLAVLAVPSIVWWLRRRSVRRSAARFESAEPTFLMTGAIAPPRFVGERHCDLHLWPLDAEAGAPSQCRVPLLSTGGSPIGGPAFTVEVKGSPRPLGRLVARVQDGPLLWPVGAASFGGARPRPVEIDRVAPFVPAPPLPPPRPPRWWTVTRIPLAVSAVSALVWIVVTGTVLVNAAAADEIASAGTPVIATVEAREEGRLLVTYQVDEGGPAIQGRVPSDVPRDYTIGRRYPAHAAPDDPTRLRFDGEPYDRAQPIGSITFVLLAALTALAIALMRWRRLCALAQDGPWWEVEASAGQRRDALRILVPGTDQVPCTVDIRGLGGSDWELPTLTKRRVLVAGALEPGSLVAVRDGAKLLDREHLMASAHPSLRRF